MLISHHSLGNRIASAIALACFFMLLTATPSAQAFKQHPSRKHMYKQEVEALEEQWRTAQLNNDVAAMDRLLSDDYVGISINGRVYTKTQQLERMREGLLVLTRLDLGEMKVKLVGQVAIVTSSATVAGTINNNPLDGRYRYLRVYQRQKNAASGWKITSFEITRISRGGNHNPDSSPANSPGNP